MTEHPPGGASIHLCLLAEQSDVKTAGSEEGCAGTGVNVECTAVQSSTKIVGSKTTRVHMEFMGCTGQLATGGPKVPCSNTPTPGQILSGELEGTLGYISKAPLSVGESLVPLGKERVFLRFSCEPITVVVGAAKPPPYPWNLKKWKHKTLPVRLPYYGKHGGGGSVISTIKPINEYTKVFINRFICQPRYENFPPKFESPKRLDVLETAFYETANPGSRSAWGPSCVEMELNTVFGPEEEWEIEA